MAFCEMKLEKISLASADKEISQSWAYMPLYLKPFFSKIALIGSRLSP